MLPFAFLVTGAQAGIWEAAMSLLNTGNGFFLLSEDFSVDLSW